mmetsp:Transcript_16771/g.28479  ORF Transcript_16771/g.28479 Transcript_16771/m.28479 type:complete len:251 (+) Transcript_16771:337-1089(+)
MISEIPTIAIEKVIMWQNTSIIPDENLSHRLGLIPIKADAQNFDYFSSSKETEESEILHFKLHKVCTKKDPSAPTVFNCSLADEDKLFNNANVYSGDLEWHPVGNQEKNLGTIRPVHDDILIAKLRPGQEIELEVTCHKGIGKTHTKWSPVCTAYYRLLPDITFTEKIKGSDAKELKKLCPVGVFDIEDIGKEKVATVVNEGVSCTTCRECIRHEKFANKINLGKKLNVYEFHVESVGIYKPEEIVRRAI